jgi:CheY-like chemotaxis protein
LSFLRILLARGFRRIAFLLPPWRRDWPRFAKWRKAVNFVYNSTERVEPTGDAEESGPKEYAKVVVRDTGVGISEEVLNKVFVPFFMTKPRGEGAGMGLSVAHGIVIDHGGWIRVSSKIGQGSTFEALFPLLETVEEDLESESAPLTRGHGERILIVDDESSILGPTSALLHLLDYQVITKNDSLEALGLFSTQPQAFDLVITDQTMPHLTGLRLAEAMRRLRPDIPILLCTGHSTQISPESIEKSGVHKILLKPISRRVMAEAVNEALEGAKNQKRIYWASGPSL